MIPDRIAEPPGRKRWPILAVSVALMAAMGISRFSGQPRALPLDEAIRTLVSCQSSNERELAMGVVASRARELVVILATQERQGARYAATHLDNLVDVIRKERTR